MVHQTLNIKDLLNVIFKVTKKNANLLADFYVNKDVSIIRKWYSGKVLPDDKDIKAIVAFTTEVSTEIQCMIIRDYTERMVLKAVKNEDIRAKILSIKNFEEFMTEVLNISTLCDMDETYKNSTIECSSKKDDSKRKLGVEGLIKNIDNIHGTYIGSLDFDLHIYKSDKKNNYTRFGIKLGNDDNLIEGFLNRKVQTGSLKKKQILGLIVLGVIISLFAVQSSGSSKVRACENVLEPTVPSIKIFVSKDMDSVSIPAPFFIDNVISINKNSTPSASPKPTYTNIVQKTGTPEVIHIGAAGSSSIKNLGSTGNNSESNLRI